MPLSSRNWCETVVWLRFSNVHKSLTHMLETDNAVMSFILVSSLKAVKYDAIFLSMV